MEIWKTRKEERGGPETSQAWRAENGRGGERNAKNRRTRRKNIHWWFLTKQSSRDNNILNVSQFLIFPFSKCLLFQTCFFPSMQGFSDWKTINDTNVIERDRLASKVTKLCNRGQGLVLMYSNSSISVIFIWLRYCPRNIWRRLGTLNEKKHSRWFRRKVLAPHTRSPLLCNSICLNHKWHKGELFDLSVSKTVFTTAVSHKYIRLARADSLFRDMNSAHRRLALCLSFCCTYKFGFHDDNKRQTQYDHSFGDSLYRNNSFSSDGFSRDQYKPLFTFQFEYVKC